MYHTNLFKSNRTHTHTCILQSRLFHDLGLLGIYYIYTLFMYLYYFFKPTKIRSITNRLVMVHYLKFNHHHVSYNAQVQLYLLVTNNEFGKKNIREIIQIPKKYSEVYIHFVFVYKSIYLKTPIKIYFSIFHLVKK